MESYLIGKINMSHIATVSATALAFDQTMNGAYSILDPINDIFYYLVPKLGTFFTGSAKISKKEAERFDVDAERDDRLRIRTEISKLAEAAGLQRKVSPFFATTFSSYGGKYSLTSPVVQVPKSLFVRTRATLENGKKIVLGNFGTEKKLGNSEIEEYEVLKTAKPETLNANELSRLSELEHESQRQQILRESHWRFTDQETRFLVLRSLVQIRMNDSMFKIIARVAMVAAIILLKISPLSWPISLTILLLAVLLYFAIDRYTQGKLDSEALKSLMKISDSKVDAVEAALNALKKIKEQNLELKGARRLANILIDKEGNERFNLGAPPLSKRIREIEKLRLQILRRGEEPEIPPDPLTEAGVIMAIEMGGNPFPIPQLF